MKTALYFLIIFCFISNRAIAQEAQSNEGLFINVGEANVKQSNLALPPFRFMGPASQAKGDLEIGKTLFATIYKDLSISGFFSFMSQDSFVEDTSKVGLKPKPQDPQGFNFSSWQQIGAEFLIRGGFKTLGNDLKLEAYLYYVPKMTALLAKNYSSPKGDPRKLAHRFANDVVEKLTGKKGIFETRIVSAKSTGSVEKEIFLMDWDGQNQKQISQHKSISVSPSWSADGKFITYTAYVLHKKMRGRNADLFKYDLTTGSRKLLSHQLGINSGATFFPDLSKFVMWITKNQNSDLYVMNMDGSISKRLTNGPNGAMNVEPSISPDGKTIAFSSDRSGRPMVYLMDSDGGNVRRLTIAGKYNATPRWSPDGKKIAFAGEDKGSFDIFTMNADGTGMVRLTTATKRNGKRADNESPSFSPDGRHILFTSNRTGTNQLYVTDVQGVNEHQLTFDGAQYYSPRWSPVFE